MKLDTDYTFIRVCPATGKPLILDEHGYSRGICPRCGHNDGSTFTHSKKIVGRYLRPTQWEWLRGKRKEFIPTEVQDGRDVKPPGWAWTDVIDETTPGSGWER